MAEREGMLRTKAMREKEEMKERRKYRFALMRIRFPDGLVLQVPIYLHSVEIIVKSIFVTFLTSKIIHTFDSIVCVLGIL